MRNKSLFKMKIVSFLMSIIMVVGMIPVNALEMINENDDLNIENISFLIQVFWQHVKDLIELIIPQENISSTKKLEFLETVLKNDLFCKNVSIWEDIDLELFEYFGNCVEQIVSGDTLEQLQTKNIKTKIKIK